MQSPVPTQAPSVAQVDSQSLNGPLTKVRALACRRCRQKKQKCDNAKPKCSHCERAGIECLPTEPSSKSDVPKSYVDALQNRIALLEEKLRALNPEVADDHLHNQVSIALSLRDQRRLGSILSPESHDSRLHVSNHATQNPIFAQDALHDDAGNSTTHMPTQAVPFPISLAVPNLPLENDCPSHQLSISQSSPGIDRGVQDWLDPQLLRNTTESTASLMISIYFQAIHSQYPFLHRGTWDELYENWKQRQRFQSTSSGCSTSWEDFVVSMIFSIGALIMDRSFVGAHDSRSYYHLATTVFFPKVLQEASLLYQTQGFLLLAMHALHCSSSSTIIQLNTNAIRTAVTAGLHRRESMRGTKNHRAVLETQIRQLTWWSCYILDRAVATSFGYPVSIPDEYITMDLFADVDDACLTKNTKVLTPRNSENSAPTSTTATLHRLRARLIQSRILTALAQTNSMDNALRSGFFAELDTWRASINDVAKHDRLD